MRELRRMKKMKLFFEVIDGRLFICLKRNNGESDEWCEIRY